MMKKIIDNLLYDTETSELIHNDEINKRLWYLTPNGNYFCFFKNGDIVPKTEEAVKDYLGKNDVEKYIELFGEPQEA